MADTTAKKTTAKKASPRTSAKKASPKKTSAKKAPTKNLPRKKAPAKRSAPRAAAPHRRSSGARMAETARDAVEGLTGKSPESITALERSDDGWRVAVEVLELERIPSTTDVMATYEVTLDEQGELEGYRRVHRYLRGSSGDE